MKATEKTIKRAIELNKIVDQERGYSSGMKPEMFEIFSEEELQKLNRKEERFLRKLGCAV